MMSGGEGIFWAMTPNSFTWSTNKKTSSVISLIDCRRFQWIEEKHHIMWMRLGSLMDDDRISNKSVQHLRFLLDKHLFNEGDQHREIHAVETCDSQSGRFATPSTRSTQWISENISQNGFLVYNNHKGSIGSPAKNHAQPSFMRELQRELEASLPYARRIRDLFEKVHPPF